MVLNEPSGTLSELDIKVSQSHLLLAIITCIVYIKSVTQGTILVFIYIMVVVLCEGTVFVQKKTFLPTVELR